LRKAISAGRNWPKRRKIDRAEFVAPNGDGVFDEVSKSKLVNALLDTVNSTFQDGEAQQPEHQHSPDSSPRKRSRDSAMPSPIVATPPNPRSGVSNSAHEAILISSSSDGMAPAPDCGVPIADYWDDDLDDDTFIEMADCSTTIVELEPLDQPHKHASQEEGPISKPAARNDKFFSDDYGELDDKVFQAAEAILSKLEQPAAPNPPPQTTTHLQTLPAEGEEDDAFGDDFGGDFDFDAAELAATQMTRPPTQSTIPVRRKT
jgi:DNA replication ATP-dependent helicase Dna2